MKKTKYKTSEAGVEN